MATYKRLIRSMPRANQYLLLYVLDLLSVFARKCERNLMTATSRFFWFLGWVIGGGGPHTFGSFSIVPCHSVFLPFPSLRPVLPSTNNPSFSFRSRSDLPPWTHLAPKPRNGAARTPAQPESPRVPDRATGLVHVGYPTAAWGCKLGRGREWWYGIHDRCGLNDSCRLNDRSGDQHE